MYYIYFGLINKIFLFIYFARSVTLVGTMVKALPGPVHKPVFPVQL